MAGIPQISTPIGGKGYQTGNLTNKPASQSAEQFDIVQVERPITTVDAAGEQSQGGKNASLMAEQRDFLQMAVKIAKDPGMAGETLKQILNDELLAVVKSNGYTELYGELDDLMKSMFVSPDNLVNEIMAQEQENTLFSGSAFFDILRNISNSAKATNNNELKNAVANMLKAVNSTQNKQEILHALSSNMKFLGDYFAPNKNLSESLQLLAEKWGASDAAENFEDLKNITLEVIKNVSNSLLNSEKTQSIIPLVVHNLSKYNTNDDMITDYFSQLLSLLPSSSQKTQLMQEFDQLLRNIFSGTAGEVQGDTPEAMANPNGTAVNNGGENLAAGQQQGAVSQGGVPNELQVAAQNEVSPQSDTAANQGEQAINPETGEPIPTQSMAQGSANTSTTSTATTDNKTVVSFLQQAAEDGTLEQSMNFDLEEINAPVRTFLLGKIDGKTALAETLRSVFNTDAARETVSADVEQMQDIDTVVNYLNDILRLVPDVDERQDLYEALLEIVNTMAENEELPPTKSGLQFSEDAAAKSAVQSETQTQTKTVLDDMLKFVEKNIDHSALKTINNYNASNLLQSLINAPGVFTPLTHFIIPIEVEDTKAFGELWVDNESETSGVSGEKSYHLFLTFDVEEIGRFEIDMRSTGKDVNLSLLHPEGFGDRINPIQRKVNRIVAQSGYVTKSFTSGPLKKPRELTEVFPSIKEKRGGFNVTA